MNSIGPAVPLPARNRFPGTALAIINIPSVPAVQPGHERFSHDVIGAAPSPLKQLASGMNVRRISPREMSDFSLDLYAAGIISFDDYSALSEHPELNPYFDKTIGALTNEKAQPDGKRDLVRYWEDKLDFAMRHTLPNNRNLDQAKRIVGLMRYLSRRVLMPG